MACLAATLAATVAHGALRPLLESRGVCPWRVRDTLAAIPLILLGCAGVGAAGGMFTMAVASVSRDVMALTPWVAGGAALLAVLSCGVLLLGILALRKLS